MPFLAHREIFHFSNIKRPSLCLSVENPIKNRFFTIVCSVASGGYGLRGRWGRRPPTGFWGPGPRLGAGTVLTVAPSSPCVVGSEVCSLEMELLCSLPSGDKEEEGHQRGGAADQQAEGDAAGTAGQGGADPEAAAGGEWLTPPHFVCECAGCPRPASHCPGAGPL